MEKKKWSKNKIVLIIIIVLSLLTLVFAVSVGLIRNNTHNNEIQLKDSFGKIKLTINETYFETKSSNINLSGTVTLDKNLSGTVYIRYNTYAEDDYNLSNSIFTGETIATDKMWEIDKVHVLPGNSKIVISASIGGVVEEQIVDVYYDQGERYNEFNEENVKYDETLKTEYINNIITIFANDNTDENNLNTILKNFGGEIVGRSSNIYDIKLNSEYTLDEIEAICDKLEKYNEISFAHAHYVTNITNNTSIRDSINAYEIWEDTGNWGIKAIEVPSAWNYKERFSDINIGVVDTGFDLTHEDLKGKLYPATDNMENINDYNYWDTEKQVETINSHGTIVAGIIGAIKDKKGITGILDNVNIIYSDWQPNETKLKQSWNRETAVLQSLVDSVKSGAKIINYSLGSSASLNYSDFLKDYNCNRGDINQPQAWKDKQAEIASEYILSLLRDEYDFLIVQASGNGWKVEVESGKWEWIAVDATNSGFWSCITENNLPKKATEQEKQYILDSIIIVGNAKKNSDGNYQQATRSNGGKRVDICAPGTDIFSTEVNNSYGYSTGTSVAAPHVTGVCGMVWSVNPDFSSAEVKEIVCNYTSITVHDNPDGNHPLNNTYPMVNAKLAVEEAIYRTDNANAFISGLVKDDITDKPIQSVKVTVKFDQTERYVKTDKNGNFELVLPEGEYELIVEMDGYATKRISEKCKKDVETVLLDTIYLTPTSYLMGTVIDKETNKPVDDASVLLQKIDEAGLIVGEYTCSTDTNGQFEINVPVGTYAYTINKLDMFDELYETAPGTTTVEKATGNILGTIYLTPKHKVIELKDYMGKNIETEAKQISGMKKVEVSDGSIEYKNEFLIFGASFGSNKISFIAIDSKCNYSIHNISIGNDFDSVCRNLESNKWRNDGVVGIENGGTYSNFVKNNLRITILAENNIVTSINYFVAEQDAEDIEMDSGKCGDNVFWQLNGNGELIISGSGSITNYSHEQSPWYSCHEAIKLITIKDGITHIGNYAFEDCIQLTSIAIPNTVISIGDRAFDGCHKLTNVEIPNSVTKIGEWIFLDCMSLKSIVIPNSITEIPAFAFYECSGLESVVIGEGVISIGDDAFYKCSGLTDIVIPESVQRIGCWAFQTTGSLDRVVIKNPDCYIDDDSGTIYCTAYIYGYPNSTAQKYAEKHYRDFVVIDGNNDTIDSIADLNFEITKVNVDMFLSGVLNEITEYNVDLGSISVSHDVDGYEYMKARVELQTSGLDEDSFYINFYPKRNSGSNRLYYIEITSGYFKNENDSIYLSHKILIEAIEKYLSGESEYEERVHTITSFDYGKNGVSYFLNNDEYKCTVRGNENLMDFISYTYIIRDTSLT